MNRRVRACVLLLSLALGAAFVLLPNATQAAAQPDVRQATSPLATPAAEEEPAETPQNGAGAQAGSGSASASASAGQMAVPAVAIGALRGSQPMTVTLTGEVDEAGLRAFVRYLLSGYGPYDSQITVTVGAQPEAWPLALTLPEGAEAIGGYVRRGEYEENVLFVQGAATGEEEAETGLADATAALVDALHESLLADGYRVPPDASYGGGTPVFLPTSRNMPDFFCDPDGDYVVSLWGVAIYGEPPAVRITLSPDLSGDLCSGRAHSVDSSMFAILPQLTPPPDAEVMPYGTSVGISQMGVNARITSEQTAAELAEHYETQLAEAGWENLGRAAADPIAWSSWSFQDPDGHEWTATFTVVQQGGDATSFEAALNVARSR